MVQNFFQRCKEFCNTPTPVYPPTHSISIGLKVVLFFCAFYFIFKFGHIPEKIGREIIEFSSIVFGLFFSVLVLGIISYLYLKISGKRLVPVFGYSIFEFIFIYSGMVVIRCIIHHLVYETDTIWNWKYYWRHFPFALLVFSVYAYREYKKVVIDQLVLQLNTRLEQSERREIIPVDTGQSAPPLSFQVDGLTKKISPSDITHISISGHYLDIFHQKDDLQEFISVRRPLKEMIEELPESLFLKIHRSHVVNLEYITGCKKRNRQYIVELNNNQFSLPISRSNLSQVMSRIEARI